MKKRRPPIHAAVKVMMYVLFAVGQQRMISVMVTGAHRLAVTGQRLASTVLPGKTPKKISSRILH
jgi:hypothetical protein